jgi:hypothetical protein
MGYAALSGDFPSATFCSLLSPSSGLQILRRDRRRNRRTLLMTSCPPVDDSMCGRSHQNRHLTSVHSATIPSRQVIFLPSETSLPAYEIGTS